MAFQGYISWNHTDSHVYQLHKSLKRNDTIKKGVSRPHTDRDKHHLPQHNLIQLVEVIAWRKTRADDTILLHQVASNLLQTSTRPGQLLDTCRVNVKLTNPAEEVLSSLFGSVPFSEVGTSGAIGKVRSSADSFAFEIGTFGVSSLDPHAAHGARLVHDYQRMSDPNNTDSMPGGLAEPIRSGSKGNGQVTLLSTTGFGTHTSVIGLQWRWQCLMETTLWLCQARWR